MIEFNYDTQYWEEFYLHDIFDIEFGNKFDLNKMCFEHPKINFVSRTSNNNGIVAVVDEVENKTPFTAGCLTIALGGSIGSTFYQESPFYTAQNVAVCKGKKGLHLSKNAKLFIKTLIELEVGVRFRAFGRELNRHIRKNFPIKLPVNMDGLPDFDFMDNYMKSLGISLPHTDIEGKDVLMFNHLSWGDFCLGDSRLFSISSGKYYYADEYISGKTPYVTAANTNNGIAKFIDIEPDFSGNQITIGKIGATSFYQGESFCATSDVNIVTSNFFMNKYIGIFVATIINFSENYKWNYGRQARIGDCKEMYLKLPIDQNGEPDWQYMETYIKSLPFSDVI